MTGLSVTLPYGDSEFYGELEDVFNKCGFDSKYLSFLYKFVDADNVSSYDWGSSGFDGWGSYDESYYENDYYWNDYDWSCFDWDDFYSSDYDWDDYDYSDDWNYDYWYDDYNYYDYCDDYYYDDYWY